MGDEILRFTQNDMVALSMTVYYPVWTGELNPTQCKEFAEFNNWFVFEMVPPTA